MIQSDLPKLDRIDEVLAEKLQNLRLWNSVWISVK